MESVKSKSAQPAGLSPAVKWASAFAPTIGRKRHSGRSSMAAESQNRRAIPDNDGSPGGIICANTDDTRRVIGER